MAKKHPNKDIRAALDYAEQEGWRIEEGGSDLTLGEKFIALTTILNVDAENFV